MITQETSLDVIVRKLYALEVLSHKAHENTLIGFHHEAFGEYYDSVISIKDRIIEGLIGSGKLMKVNVSILEICDDSEISKEATNTTAAFDTYANQSGDNALINLSGELIEATNKLKYKLRMS